MAGLAKSPRWLFGIVAAVCVVDALVAVAAAALYPCEGGTFASSFTWWLIAVPAGLVLYAVVEALGAVALERPSWRRMPSGARVVVLVALICVLTVGVVSVGKALGIDVALARMCRH